MPAGQGDQEALREVEEAARLLGLEVNLGGMDVTDKDVEVKKQGVKVKDVKEQEIKNQDIREFAGKKQENRKRIIKEEVSLEQEVQEVLKGTNTVLRKESKAGRRRSMDQGKDDKPAKKQKSKAEEATAVETEFSRPVSSEPLEVRLAKAWGHTPQSPDWASDASGRSSNSSVTSVSSIKSNGSKSPEPWNLFEDKGQTNTKPSAPAGRGCSLCKVRFVTLKELAAHIENVHKTKNRGPSPNIEKDEEKSVKKTDSLSWKLTSEEKLAKIKGDFDRRRHIAKSGDKPSLGLLRNILPDIKATPVVPKRGGRRGVVG